MKRAPGMSKLKHWFMDLIAGYAPSCEVTTERISLAQDGKLNLWERLGTRLHLAICVWCTNYHRQITFLTEATRARAKDDSAIKAARNGLSDAARRCLLKTHRDISGQ